MAPRFSHLAVLLLPSFLSMGTGHAADPGETVYQTGFLSKQEALESIELPDGHRLELLLNEPQVEEPVMVAWDRNGAMYVVRMETSMQDLNASGEKAPKSRITRHVDSNGDGPYDPHTVLAKNLKVPRFVLPLDDRVVVGTTDTLDLWTFRDTTGDGVADEIVKVHEGGRRGGNMEHQPSGLVWALDNWIYLTYEAQRDRFTEGKLAVQELNRGDRLPEDLRGDLLIPEPVGRMIRHAVVDRKDTKTVLRSATPGLKFIRTRDVNIRPVWTATTPGGRWRSSTCTAASSRRARIGSTGRFTK